ncbi:MAG: CHAT domain-containing protein [Saprospiraceae bacterium]|nr:CHAT domain-containing protein [Saprospiraceae bacterium]
MYDKAELLHLEAKAIREKILGKESVDYANSLSNLSTLNLNKGNYKECESLCLEAKTIREKTQGNSHPDYMTPLGILARLYTVMGSYEKVEPLYVELFHKQNAYAIQALTHLSERELNRFIIRFSEIEDQLLSFALKTRNQSNPTSRLCYDNSLFKGFLLYTSSRIQQLAASNPTNVEKFNQLKSCHRRLAREYAKPIAERKDVEAMETQANDVEKDLAGTVAGYREAIRQVNWQEVQQQLRPGEVAIEYVHYQYYNPNPTDSVMYAALLLRPGDSQPVFVPLFEEKQLLSLLSKDEATSSSTFFAQAYSRGITPAKQENYQGLYELVWQSLDTLLTGVKTVYYSPSGAIHRLNLSAIAVDKKSTLTDRYQLVRLGSTRSLVVADTISSYADNSAALFGGIVYEADTTTVERDSTDLPVNLAGSLSFANAERGVDQRGESWGALSGAKDEVTRIDKLLKSRHIKSHLWSDREATEEVFKNLGKTEPSPRIVHLATHGFFFPDPQAEIHSHGLGIQDPVFKLSEHPMIRSGLVLAGGNYAWKTSKSPHPDGEDGILTAYEISQMNLSNTELVVLSACETGLGDIEGNEGVYGLQRAFKIAGAKYLIMSLWQVPDRETSVFMTRFYEHWLEERRPIPEAFQQTQQEMRRRFPNPYQWAGFILME